jgi:hypothetical protein
VTLSEAASSMSLSGRGGSRQPAVQLRHLRVRHAQLAGVVLRLRVTGGPRGGWLGHLFAAHQCPRGHRRRRSIERGV